MARTRRVQYPGAVYHVMARGNRKAPIFEDDSDRKRFLELIGRAAERYAFGVYGICLMSNHYHLVGTTERGQLSETLRFINGVYAQASNRRHARTGHLFEARFRSLIVQEESYLRQVARYVVLNPVRARLTSNAAAWPWSSYRATAGIEPPPDWLSCEWLLWAFDTTDPKKAQERYRKYVNGPAPRRSRIDITTLAIGRPDFQERIADLAYRGRPQRSLPLGPRPAAPPALETLFRSRSGHWLSHARSAYRAHTRYGYRLSDIARHLRVDPSTVSKWMSRMPTPPADLAC